MICIIKEFRKLFSEPNEKLTYTTKVIGGIRTATEKPVYTRFYPYPFSLKPELEAQVKAHWDYIIQMALQLNNKDCIEKTRLGG